MALMRVLVDVLMRDVFRDAEPGGVFYSAEAVAIEDGGATLVLEVTGQGIPNVPEVVAICHRQRALRVEFVPADFREPRPRTVPLDGRGDAAPRNPEDQGDGA